GFAETADPGDGGAVAEAGVPVVDGPQARRRLVAEQAVAPRRQRGRLAVAAGFEVVGVAVLEAAGVVRRVGGVTDFGDRPPRVRGPAAVRPALRGAAGA